MQYLIARISLLYSKEISEMNIGSITTKGQITIPKEIRASLDLKEGDKVIFVIEGGQTIIRKASRERLSEILHRQKPWKEHSIRFQKRMRKEW
ncbi:Regulators of stationary/sporulation gene expression [Candidatus Nitrosotalea okcheonensis]|uniref:Regulators of stationary/sporulation gene expression n=2 Tax=Candidatus Nitrosotalea okcheonensis TaxID=1903276 RepID=A0A2H1FHN0_9ARCH|nr:Regulators of stationary/sporulation gene expression [Candidatus Nitrosotalea okcheonensis]